jgi:hypothetical protein
LYQPQQRGQHNPDQTAYVGLKGQKCKRKAREGVGGSGWGGGEV